MLLETLIVMGRRVLTCLAKHFFEEIDKGVEGLVEDWVGLAD